MKKVEVTLDDLVLQAGNTTAEAAVLRAQLDKVLTLSQAREAQLATTVNAIKEKYTSTIMEATDKANSITATAERSAAESLAASKKVAADELKSAKEKGQSIVANATAQADAVLATAKEERSAWEAEKELVADVQKFQPKVKLDVGGVKFTTSLTTLRRFPDTMIGAMFSGRHALPQDADGYHFIDRDGTHFRYILNFLRSPETFDCKLTGEALAELRHERDYYGLDDVMFPFKPMKPFQTLSAKDDSVVVTQDSQGIYTVEGVPVRVCKYCKGGDYVTDSNIEKNEYYRSEYYHYIGNFVKLIEDRGGNFYAAQRIVASPCRLCGKKSRK